MKKIFLFFIFILALSAAVVALAQTPADVQYPVQELGGCKDQASCKAYCDNPENSEACMAFARKNKIMSEDEIRVAEKFLSGDIKGPGGCSTKDKCEAYCDDMAHIDECVSFAEKNNLMPAKDLEEAKKVQAAIANGVKPPPCGSKKSCDAYCEDSDHMEECINFGIQAGFIQGKELEDAQKMLQAIKKGVKPPPCKGKEACDEYCSNPDNMEVCMNFAIEAGMMSEQEKQDSQKMLQAIKKGVKPPPCKGKEECDSYCQTPEHASECIDFAVAAGMMDAKDAEMAKKTGGKGPGGCKGKEECEAFCKDPANQETCFSFAKDNGMIPEEDLKKMEEGKKQMMNAINTAPSETVECLNKAIGSEMVEKLKNGTGMMGKDLGDKMGECFQQSGNGRGIPCNSPEECKSYCDSHPDECKDKQGPPPEQQNKPEDQNSGPRTGPGGCASEAECQAYCASHREECGAPPEGTMMQKCEGDNCQPPRDQGPPPEDRPRCEGPDCGPVPENIQGRMPPQDQQMQRCEGENCQGPPGNQPPPEAQGPPPTDQSGNPPPPPPSPPPPSSYLKPDTFVGSVLYIFARAIYPLVAR